MKIDTILKYQQLDLDLMKLENELLNSQAAKEFNFSKNTQKNAQELLLKLNKDAADVIAQMETFISQHSLLIKQLQEAESAEADIKDVNAADFFIRNVEKLSSMLLALSRDVSKLSSRIVDINSQRDKAMTAGRDATKNLTTQKDAYEAEKARLLPQAAQLQKDRADIEKSLDDTFISHYKRLRQQKKTPPVVALLGANSCGGCFMEMAVDAIGKLKSDGDIIECPNCGRLIYKG